MDLGIDESVQCYKRAVIINDSLEVRHVTCGKETCCIRWEAPYIHCTAKQLNGLVARHPVYGRKKLNER